MKTKRNNGTAIYIMIFIVLLEVLAIVSLNSKHASSASSAAEKETVYAGISDEDMKIIMENAPEGLFSINEEYEKLLKQRETLKDERIAEIEALQDQDREIIIETVIENGEDAISETEQEETEAEVEYSPYKGIELSEEEFAEFCQMVEAEVTGDSPDHFRGNPTELQIWWAKLRCARCILNRIESKEFPDDMHAVLFQPGQFAPITDGRYWDVCVTDMTMDACRAALDSAQHDDVPDVLFFRMGHWTSRAAKEHFIKTDALGISYYSEI